MFRFSFIASWIGIKVTVKKRNKNKCTLHFEFFVFFCVFSVVCFSACNHTYWQQCTPEYIVTSLLVNYEVMLCALITCLSEDPRICIALPRCTKHMSCVMLIAMAIYSASVINHIYFGEKPLSFQFYAYTMVLCSEIACSDFGHHLGWSFYRLFVYLFVLLCVLLY